MMNKAIITQKEAFLLLRGIKNGVKTTKISLNLGKSTESVKLEKDFVILRGEKIDLMELQQTKEDTCYVADGGKLNSINFFSDKTNLFYKLKPTKDWPTITLSSVPMHRYKHITPKEDTMRRSNELSGVSGPILDTCCGLGYTAIMSAKKNDVTQVIVFEKDVNVLRIAEYNPYSEELFSNKKIVLKKEDVFGESSRFKAIILGESYMIPQPSRLHQNYIQLIFMKNY